MYLPLQPGQSFQVVGESSVAGDFEIEEADSRIALYAWHGGSFKFKVYCDGELIQEVD
jgi:hypothetical protein